MLRAAGGLAGGEDHVGRTATAGAARTGASRFAGVRPGRQPAARHRGRPRPVVVLDDLHWADPDSLALLEFAARQLAGQRVLLLRQPTATTRPATGCGAPRPPPR